MYRNMASLNNAMVCYGNDSNAACGGVSNAGRGYSNASNLSNSDVYVIGCCDEIWKVLSNLVLSTSNTSNAPPTSIVESDNCMFGSNTAAWASNAFATMNSNNCVFGSNTAAWASNAFAGIDSNCCAFASNTGAWSSNYLSNVYLALNGTPISSVPTAAGNTTSLNQVVIDPDGVKWIIDNQGRAMRLNVVEPIALTACQVNDQSIPDSSTTLLMDWGAAETDTALGGWNPMTGELTIMRDGLYRVEARVVYNASLWPEGAYNFTTVAVNGSSLDQTVGAHYSEGTATYPRASIAANGVIKLVKTDTVAVAVYQNSGSDQTTYGSQCILTVNEVCP
jgi:hypothetical protein